ncbi:MAG TPA: c-type cytochrome [Candidatus Angelobacter sp.]|nr:c-type cytochrome [Candidatus Angelobacter sp.]
MGIENKTGNSGAMRGIAGIVVVLVVFAAAGAFWVSRSAVKAAPAPTVQSSNAPQGDAAHGQDLFARRCGSCHSLDNDKEGPRLRGVYGRKAATVASFKYSDGLTKSGIVWDGDALDKWLTNPEKIVPDTDMDFLLGKADERADIIAYLKQLSNK